MTKISGSFDTLLDQSNVRSDGTESKMRKTKSSSRQCLMIVCIIAIILAISFGVGLFVAGWKASTITATKNDQINVPPSQSSAPVSDKKSVSSDFPSSAPSLAPSMSAAPTSLHSESPTSGPSDERTSIPSATPSYEPSTTTFGIPTPLPIRVTAYPTPNPTMSRMGAPMVVGGPTVRPTALLTEPPMVTDVGLPTMYSTLNPTTRRAAPPIVEGTRTTFYAIGDVPYTERQAVELVDQMEELPKDAEFVIHVGDVRNGEADEPCLEADYANAASILSLSHAPVFVILGDNDWNDCINRDEALGFWKTHLHKFDSRHWKHSFNVIRQPNRSENFAFTHKGALFVGLNLVGGAVHSESEWKNRLTDQASWTMELIRNHRDAVAPLTGRVILFGQADPRSSHNNFFHPLKDFIRDELENRIPILYINGDKHVWRYEPNFLGQSSFLRIMLSGQTKDPPLKVVVNANGERLSTKDAFLYDRSP